MLQLVAKAFITAILSALSACEARVRATPTCLFFLLAQTATAETNAIKLSVQE